MYRNIIAFFAYWADPEESIPDKIGFGAICFLLFAGASIVGSAIFVAMIQFFPWAELILLAITIVFFSLIYLCKWAYKVNKR